MFSRTLQYSCFSTQLIVTMLYWIMVYFYSHLLEVNFIFRASWLLSNIWSEWTENQWSGTSIVCNVRLFGKNSIYVRSSQMVIYSIYNYLNFFNIFRHTLCALEDKCMNPPKAKLECKTIPSWDIYAECFRYDQSSINLIMFNFFRNHNHYFMDAGSLTRTYEHY